MLLKAGALVGVARAAPARVDSTLAANRSFHAGNDDGLDLFATLDAFARAWPPVINCSYDHTGQ